MDKVRNWAVHNPLGRRIAELPIIYGFNNGGSGDNHYGCLIAEDGTELGGHICSNEHFMLGDLGILEGSRPDRHERFRQHYPDGYRMTFVSHADVMQTPGLVAAFERNKDLPNPPEPAHD